MPEQQQKNCPQIPNPHKVIKFLQPQTHNCTHIKFSQPTPQQLKKHYTQSFQIILKPQTPSFYIPIPFY